jgi:hypothetical protein
MEVNGQLHTLDILPLERDFIIYWLGGWLCPKASLLVVKKKFLGPTVN